MRRVKNESSASQDSAPQGEAKLPAATVSASAPQGTSASPASAPPNPSVIALARTGLRMALRSPLLTLGLYLVALVPAWVFGHWVTAAMEPHLSSRPFADGLADGRILDVLWEVMAQPGAEAALEAVLITTTMLLVFGWVLRLLATAGVVGLLVEHRHGGSIFRRERETLGRAALRNLGLFLRAAIARWVLTVPALVVLLLIFAPFRSISTRMLDERWLYTGFLLAVAVALPLALWARLGAHLACADGVERRRRQSFRGAFRAAAAVLRQPLRPLLLALVFVVPALLLQLLHFVLFPTALAIGAFGALLLQQLVFLARAGLEVAWWGSVLELRDTLGAPPWAGRAPASDP